MTSYLVSVHAHWHAHMFVPARLTVILIVLGSRTVDVHRSPRL